MNRPITQATYGNVRAAVAAARSGIQRELEGNVGMSVEEAERFARSLLNDGGPPVGLRVEGQVLYLDPV